MARLSPTSFPDKNSSCHLWLLNNVIFIEVFVCAANCEIGIIDTGFPAIKDSKF